MYTACLGSVEREKGQEDSRQKHVVGLELDVALLDFQDYLLAAFFQTQSRG